MVSPLSPNEKHFSFRLNSYPIPLSVNGSALTMTGSVPPSAETTVRFTVDLPLSLHQAFSTLAKREQKSKAELVRMLIAHLKPEVGAIEETTVSTELTKRFTVDMPRSLHEEFSILAIRQHKKKADLLRVAIQQLLQDLKEDKLVD